MKKLLKNIKFLSNPRMQIQKSYHNNSLFINQLSVVQPSNGRELVDAEC